jgi:hypothetical protein
LYHADDPGTNFVPVLSNGTLLAIEPYEDDGEVDDINEDDRDDEEAAPL